MRMRLVKKVFSLALLFCFAFQQAGFAQVAAQLDIAKQFNLFSGPEKSRPLHMRYFSYDNFTDNFQLLLDKGDLKDLKGPALKEESRQLLKYFLIGATLPNEAFWVNLRPDGADKIIDPALAKTDIGKVLLEADLQLKRDMAQFTSPQTPEGKAYWNKLYQKAGELFGSESVTIPTLTRPWIVPGEVIIRQGANSAYIYKATLKVMLEEDHLQGSALYNFSDERMKQLNEYSSRLIRENILPKLTKEINNSARYAALRQVFYSLVLSRWFKAGFSGKEGLYSGLINKSDLSGLTSQDSWSTATYFKAYQKSFKDGEYNIQERVSTPSGQVIRRYFSGGVDFNKGLDVSGIGDKQSGFGAFIGRSSDFVKIALAKAGMTGLSGSAAAGETVPALSENTKAWAEGFASSAGVQFAHEKILKDRIAQAFKDGRAMTIFGHTRLTDREISGLIEKAAETTGTGVAAIASGVGDAQLFLERVFSDDGFIESIVKQVSRVKVDPVKKAMDKAEKELRAIEEKVAQGKETLDKSIEAREKLRKAKAAYDFLIAVNSTVSTVKTIQIVDIKRARELFVGQTRFVSFIFGEKGLDPSLFDIGDITSVEHRTIVSHAGRFAYKGGAELDGGPRTIYLTIARILGFANKGSEGLAAFRGMMMHEFEDFARGRHSLVNDFESNRDIPDQVAPLASEISRINNEIEDSYRKEVRKVRVGVSPRGAVTYSTDKVILEKYTTASDLGTQEVFAIHGSSKTHPDVPKGSRPINVMMVKADVGSNGGHGSVPSAMLEAVADFWGKAAEEGKILDFFVTRCGDDISVTVTHINGKDSPLMHKLAWDAFINATVVSKDLSLYGAGQDLLADSFSGNIKGSGLGVAEMEFIERKSEPIVVLQGDKWAPGGFNEAIEWIYTNPNSAFVSLKSKQANAVKFGVIDFEANNKKGKWAILDPQEMKGLEFSQAMKIIGGDQVTYSFSNLTAGGQDIAAVTASRLHNIAGEYTGKDDPMGAFRTQGDYPAEGIITAPFFTGRYKVFGWMMGSQEGYLLPVSLPQAKIGVYDGPPLLTAFTFNINNGRLVGFMDLMAANPAIAAVQQKVGEKTAELLNSNNFFNQGQGAAPNVELAYQKGLTRTRDEVIKWQDFDVLEQEGNASSPVAGKPVSSSPVAAASDALGGIDFKAISIVTRPIGSFSGLKFGLPVLSNVERINLNDQFDQIQSMIKSGNAPSDSRLEEYLAACYQKKELPQRRSDIIASLIELCMLQERLGYEASPTLKKMLIVAETR